MVVDRDFAASHGLRGVTHGLPLADCDTAMAAYVTGAISRRQENGRTGLLETAANIMAASAGDVESNKGVSERLSTLGGKSTRVRRKSPSKTPKNGFQRVF